MAILECPGCGDQLTRYEDITTHVKEAHIPGGSIPSSRECPECQNILTEQTLPFHFPCLINLDPDVVPLLRGKEGYMCPICGRAVNDHNALQTHIERHTAIEQMAALTDSITCSGCGQTITDGSELRNHIQCLYEGLPEGSRYECPACEEVSNDKGDLLWHIWIDHWEKEGFEANCPGCGDYVQIHEIRSHLGCVDSYEPHAVMNLLSLRAKECFFCSHEAFNHKSLADHVREEHLENLASDSQCPDCGADLQSISNRKVERHYASLARANNLDFSYGDPSSFLSCPGCQSRLDDGDELFQHVQKDHPDLLGGEGECEGCGRPVGRGKHVKCIVARGGRPSPEAMGEGEQLNRPPGLSQYPPTSRTIDSDRRLDHHDQSSYFSELQSFIDLEREAAREESWRKYRETPIHQLKYSTNLILDLIPTGKRHHPDVEVQYVFERPIPEDEEEPDPLTERFGIYPREEVIVGSTEHDTSLPITATVTFTDEQTIGIAPKPDEVQNWNRLHDELTRNDEAYHIVHLLNPRPYDREQQAIETVKQRQSRSNLIAGTTPPTEAERAVGDAYAGLLNEHQATAVGRALGANDVFCIHGPPGTGKTRTLTALIELAVARGDRVLACAHSNPATDNLLVGTSTVDEPDKGSLHATVQETDITMARVGHHSTNKVVQENYVGVPPRKADVVGSTANAAAELDENEFDLVVVDEATQASQPATFVPWLKGKQLVLAGDHRQLPPYCSDETAKEEEMHISLFEHFLDIYGADVAERLDIQYRMNEQIAQFSSDAFYEGSLDHGDRNRNWTVDEMVPLIGIDIVGTEQTRDDSHSKYNEAEADVAAMSARQLTNAGLEPADIGIITPYTAQIGVIANALQKVDIDDHRKIKIDTVDSFQGSEKEAIIVSFVRSNNYYSSGFLTFPDEGQRRLNVAITRARRRLVLIGDWETLGTVADHRSPSDSCADVYAQLADYLQEQDCLREIDKESLAVGD